MRNRGWRVISHLVWPVLLLLSACDQSPLDPNADVTIRGSVNRTGGRVVEDTGVVLSKEGDLGDALQVIASAGIACFSEDPPALCDDGLTTRTGSGGEFTFNVKGSFTQGSFGQSSTLVLSTHLPRDDRQAEGPSSSVRFQARTTALTMPLKLWEPTVQLSGDPSQVEVAWSEFPSDLLPEQARTAASRPSVTFTEAGVPVWEFKGTNRGLSFDPRLIEDTEGDVFISVEIDDVETEQENGAFLDLLFSSGTYPYTSPVGPPPSRSKPCSVPHPSGRVTRQPCPLTDGDFSNSLGPRSEPSCPAGQTCPPSGGEAIIDLGGEQPVGLVVIRGCPGTCTIDVSNDQTSWRDVGSVAGDGATTGSDVFMTPAATVSARFVRVTSPDAFDDLREVTVWGATAPPKEQPSEPPGRSLLREPRAFSDDLPRRWLWAALAGALLATVVGATFWRAGRRGAKGL